MTDLLKSRWIEKDENLFCSPSCVFGRDTACRDTIHKQLRFNSWMLAMPLIWDVASQSDGLNFLSSVLLLRLDRTVYTGLISFCSNGPNILEFNWLQHRDLPLTSYRRFLPLSLLFNLLSSFFAFCFVKDAVSVPDTVLQTSCPKMDFSLPLAFL